MPVHRLSGWVLFVTLHAAVAAAQASVHSVRGLGSETGAALEPAPTPESGPALRLPAGWESHLAPPHRESGDARGEATLVEVDPQDRHAVSLLYRDVYVPEDALALDAVNVDVGTCDPGSTPQATIDATLQRINVFRALAGLPGTVSELDAAYRDQVQAAALIFAANPDDPLDHTPPQSYACWTQDGADGASRSNLHRGKAVGIATASSGPRAITSYMDDAGDGNTRVGHRRWLLYPPQVRMASADAVAPIPGPFPYVAVNTLWVTGEGSFDFGPRPPTPDGTAWPAAGFVPWQLLPERSNRWSFSFPGASFCNAQVAMTRDGSPVGVSIVADGTSEGQCPPDAGLGTIGDPTLVWEPAEGAVDYEDPPLADVRYEVTVSGIAGNGVPPDVSYTVLVIDPYDALFEGDFDS